MRILALSITALGLVACDPQPEINNPAQPAVPVQSPDNEAITDARPGTGSQNFVGRWAAEPEWCVTPAGAQRPIEITLQRFEGYENSCTIDEIDETSGAWVLSLTCQAEGETHLQTVRASVNGDLLTLTWSDAPSAPVTFHRCSTLADTAN